MIFVSKNISLLAVLFLCLGVNNCYATTQIKSLLKKERPNVVFILTDDQGSIDANCYGASDLYTPNIDLLAETGVKFTQFYVAAPVCSPSRASLLTGKNPHAAGLPGNASSHKGHGGMPTEQVTMAELMQQAGYRTAHIGKWHLGYSEETMPLAQGFDYSYGHMGGCIDNYSHFFYWNGPNRHDLWENGNEVWEDGEYFPDLMADKVDQYLDQHKEDTFFLYYAINMPHYPLQPTSKWREHYKDMPMPRRDYAAFISTIDERIGRVLNKLEKLGLRENTIVIYQSDHGHSTEDRTFGGGGNAGPFRGAKFSLFEGGIRVPSLISYPARIPKGEVRNQMAVNVDWLPTLAQLCSIDELPAGVEGKSLVPLLVDKNMESPHDLFRWKLGLAWAIRKGDWKLLGNPQDPSKKGKLDPDKDRLFLVNLKQDSTEMINLADQYPQILEELKKEYLQWEFASENDLPQEHETFTNIAKGKKISLQHQPHSKYKAKGASSLIDEETGSCFYGDGYWLGFEQDNLEATIDLGDVMSISSVSVGCLQDAQSWIFFPYGIELSWSADGKQFAKPEIHKLKEKKDSGISIQRELFQFEEIRARYIKVKVINVKECPEWHQSAGSKAFLFVDEVVVN
jgi:arylsulfatase A